MVSISQSPYLVPSAVGVEVAALLPVLADVLVNTLHRHHRVAFPLAIAHNLLGRPLPLAHVAVDAVLHLAREGALPAQTLLADIGEHLGVGGTILTTLLPVAFQLAAHDRLVLLYRRRNHFLRKSLLVHRRNPSTFAHWLVGSSYVTFGRGCKDTNFSHQAERKSPSFA